MRLQRYRFQGLGCGYLLGGGIFVPTQASFVHFGVHLIYSHKQQKQIYPFCLSSSWLVKVLQSICSTCIPVTQGAGVTWWVRAATLSWKNPAGSHCLPLLAPRCKMRKITAAAHFQKSTFSKIIKMSITDLASHWMLIFADLLVLSAFYTYFEFLSLCVKI